ncbi:phosphatidylserine decarboxylase-domain-containing protein [Colletotrichum acutatum]|uniref:Phosphatidylserine decarboxylase-domain-containing protein n=1 Tax=Glomerella acutata TaxID=27357 RepID=A0AAD8USL5_GLOAC|nr:phosphatidylserine decarboxylase-domain-containing protein [Colletotrichum acutatum]KAK1728062.1 phosphatidylserine decarboxylase-domain-containing protein [Colletotrichum acutatum]
MLYYLIDSFKSNKDARPSPEPLNHQEASTSEKWLVHKIHQATTTTPALNQKTANTTVVDDLNPSLTNLRTVVQNDPHLATLADQMFTQAAALQPRDPTEQPAIQSFRQFLQVVNVIMRSGPQFFDRPGNEDAMGFVAAPINALLNYPMGTAAGYEFFRRREVNEAMGEVLSAWGRFLASRESRGCLRAWVSASGQVVMAERADGRLEGGGLGFKELFVCPDPEDTETLGYKSWDSFFVRRFREGVRPVEFPDDKDRDDEKRLWVAGSSSTLGIRVDDNTSVIVNACESAPLQVVSNVALGADVTLKGQPYSLTDMLNNNPLAPQFVGGTIYQAYLSAFSYHRWHAPVSGRIVEVEMILGTYFSVNRYQGIAVCGNDNDDTDGPDPQAPCRSQAYTASVATRAVVYIQARNPRIGLMAIVFVGMTEVSSCEVTVRAGEEVVKGQEIGMFHFGGSSHCLVFRPGVQLRFAKNRFPAGLEGNNRVNSALAVVE